MAERKDAEPQHGADRAGKDIKMRALSACAATILTVAACLAGPASAHTDLVKSSPMADSTGPAPKVVVLTFSKKVVAAFTGAELTMSDGMKPSVSIKVSADGVVVNCTPQGVLPAGAYKLAWHAVSAEDGHRTDGTFAFKVQ